MIRVRLVSPERVRAGETVPFTVVLENTGDRAMEIGLTGNPTAFDFVVSTESGREVWSRLRGEVVTMALQLKPLAPGERVEYRAEWGQRGNDGRPVSPGVYLVRGALLVDGGREQSAPRSLEITT